MASGVVLSIKRPMLFCWAKAPRRMLCRRGAGALFGSERTRQSKDDAMQPPSAVHGLLEELGRGELDGLRCRDDDGFTSAGVASCSYAFVHDV